MEFLDGEDLGQALKRAGPASSRRRGRRSIRQAAIGLSEAQRAGVVHRDVKPSNLVVTTAGAVKVTDFGLAKALQEDLSITATGVFVGTPDYLAPEQAMGDEVDSRADVYALGCSLYHMCSGHPPFRKGGQDDHYTAVVRRHLKAERPQLKLEIAGFDEELSDLCRRMMSRRPEVRPTFDELIDKLGEILASPRRSHPAAPPGRRAHQVRGHRPGHDRRSRRRSTHRVPHRGDRGHRRDRDRHGRLGGGHHGPAVNAVPRAERIAAAARALGGELSTRVAVYADALADALTRELGLVTWDREQLVGQLQVRLQELRRRRFREHGGAPVRVVERHRQPLEGIDSAWLHLRRGRQVRLEHEPGACSAVIELMRGMAHLLEDAVGHPVLGIGGEPWSEAPLRPGASTSSALRLALDHPEDPTKWPVVGPFSPGPRVALIEAAADRELGAYVLARASLRRAGFDPRGVKRAYVVGAVDRLHRHLHRLWVGARMGPANDPDVFAGPVDEVGREAFVEAEALWGREPDVQRWCAGGALERAGDPAIYLAPSLYAVDWPAPELPVAGPMLVVVRCTPEQARAGAEAALREGGQVIAVGVRPGAVPGAGEPDAVRYIQGALLVERLPSGLPEPRPV